jgi:hypothetical protein
MLVLRTEVYPPGEGGEFLVVTWDEDRSEIVDLCVEIAKDGTDSV